jgi:hypothetical protein
MVPINGLIITHIFWDVFTNHGSKPSCIEETRHDLCFGVPLYMRLQKLVGNDKINGGDLLKDVNELRRYMEVSSKNIKQVKAILNEHSNRIGKLEEDIASIKATQDGHGRKLDLIVQLLSKKESDESAQ